MYIISVGACAVDPAYFLKETFNQPISNFIGYRSIGLSSRSGWFEVMVGLNMT